MRTIHLRNRWQWVLALLLAFTLHAHGIQDSNSNQLSDLWEKHFNGGNLLANTPANAASADPDKDGWTNADEAVAGTDPFSGRPPEGRVVVKFIQHPSSSGIFIASWPTLQGKVYQMKVSTDLVSWANLDEPMPGTGSPIEIAFDAAFENQEGPPPALFVRVEILDTDPDGDSLTSAEELAMGLNALRPDTDLDGIADNVDPLPLANAVDANPDGLGLPAALETDLIGRWDFETSTVNFSGNPQLTYRYPDATPFARHASGNVNLHPEGMISKATASTATGVVAIPPGMLSTVAQNQSGLKPRYSVSFWAAVTPGSITAGPPIGFFGHSTYQPWITSGSTNWGLVKTQADGVWLEKSDTQADVHDLYVGTYLYSNHNNGTLINPASIVRNAAKVSFPAGKLDDGQWHHYLLTREGTNMVLYRDGVSLATNALARAVINNDTHSALSLGRLYGPSPDDNPASLGLTRCMAGRFDRLRIWSRTLALADAVSLYRQDSEKDGLWDITENRTALWRDANSDAVRVSSEVAYTVNPFRADATDVDNDHDGLSSAEEQALGTGIDDADSDDDGIPDGYDQRYCLGALVPDTNLNTDADGDGLTLAQEVAYGTNPAVADTDHDGTNDGPEVAQGGLPNDGSDDGDPPAPGEAYSLNLAIGDQSGSESEDYDMVVNRYDTGTHQETEIYRLRSGGFGQYSGLKTVGIFRKGEEYTFRIRWMGTNNDTKPTVPKEGPDYDYTMRVEPAAGATGVVITDAFDVDAGIAEYGYQLLGVHDDVQNFQGMSETVAVHATDVHIDLAVNTNMTGHIESLPDGFDADPAHQKPWDSASTLDRDLDDKNPPRSVVIDVNNNNTDAKDSNSATKGQVDNENATIDSDEDLKELTDGIVGMGHSWGSLRVWAFPLAKFKTGEYSLRLSFPNEADAAIVRVFDWQNYSAIDGTPKFLLGQGAGSTATATSVILDTAKMFGPDYNRKPVNAFRDLVMEGITYGTALLRLELLDAGDAVIASDDVRVTVNVDQYAQKAGSIGGKVDAQALRGKNPHHMGLRKANLGDPDNNQIGVRAIRGTVSLQVPFLEQKARLTPMSSRPLRDPKALKDNDGSGASFWVGLKTLDSSGKLDQWVQTGVRWVQPAGSRYASAPALYLETGDTYNNLGAKSLAQVFQGNTKDGDMLGGSARNTTVSFLTNWSSQPIRFSFILFKKPVDTTEAGSDKAVEPWQVIIEDGRGGITLTDSNYVFMSRSAPNLPASAPGGSAELNNRYKAQRFRDLDALFETNMTVTLAPGSPTQHAIIGGLKYATGFSGTPGESPTGLKDLYQWASNSFSWHTIEASNGDLTTEIKTGRCLPNGDAEIGTAPHPNWSMQLVQPAPDPDQPAPAPPKLHIWDNRSYAYPASP